MDIKLQAQIGYEPRRVTPSNSHWIIRRLIRTRTEKGGNRIHNVIRLQGMQIKERMEAKFQEWSSLRTQSRVNLHVARYNRMTKKDPKN
jgi:hypothetical protein